MTAVTTGSNIGDFHLIEKLGEGGMGAVYLARQGMMNRDVALKILRKELADDNQYTHRFLLEARATARLNHPHIVAGYDVGYEDGFYFFAMEYIQGRSLRDILDESGALMEEEVASIGAAIASALAHAHTAKLVHRDVKPDNILIDGDGTPKLADLGLAKGTQNEDYSLTQTGSTVGTPYYMSPEQINAEKDLDGRADMYALGCTLYEAATGETPFDAPSAPLLMVKHIQEKMPHPRSLQPELTNDFCAILDRMVAKERDDRYPDLNMAAEDLRAISEGRLPLCSPPPPSKSRFLPRKPGGSGKSRANQASSSRMPAIASAGPEIQASAKRLRRARRDDRSGTRFAQRSENSYLVPLFIGLPVIGFVMALFFGGFFDRSKPVARKKPEAKRKRPSKSGTEVAAKTSPRKHDSPYRTRTPRTVYRPSNTRPVDVGIEPLAVPLESQSVAPRPTIATTPKKKDTSLVPSLEPETVFPTDDLPVPTLPRKTPEPKSKKMPNKKKLDRLLAKLSRINRAGNKKIGFFFDEETNVVRGCLIEDASGIKNLKPLTELSSLRYFEIKSGGKDGPTDFSFLKQMRLNYLLLEKTHFRDLALLKHMPLRNANLGYTKIKDLTPLRGKPLKMLGVHGTKVTDLTPLKGMQLEFLDLHGTSVSDLSPLKGAPLHHVILADCEKLTDLTPLQDSRVETLICTRSGVTDLSPLKGMQLGYIDLNGTSVSDLSPLKGAPLHHVILADCPKITDLKPLRDSQIKILICTRSGVTDLSPLKGTTIERLDITGTKVTDLSPLKDTKLVALRFEIDPSRDAEILRSIKTLTEINDKSPDEALK